MAVTERHRALSFSRVFFPRRVFPNITAWLCSTIIGDFSSRSQRRRCNFAVPRRSEPSCNLTVYTARTATYNSWNSLYIYVIRTRAAARAHRKLESKRRQQQPHQKCERKRSRKLQDDVRIGRLTGSLFVGSRLDLMPCVQTQYFCEPFQLLSGMPSAVYSFCRGFCAFTSTRCGASMGLSLHKDVRRSIRTQPNSQSHLCNHLLCVRSIHQALNDVRAIGQEYGREIRLQSHSVELDGGECRAEVY